MKKISVKGNHITQKVKGCLDYTSSHLTSSISLHIHTHTYTYINVYIYVYIYTCLQVYNLKRILLSIHLVTPESCFSGN